MVYVYDKYVNNSEECICGQFNILFFNIYYDILKINIYIVVKDGRKI